MAAASVVFLEEYRQARLQTKTRQRLHAELDHRLDQLKDCMQEPSPILQQLVQTVPCFCTMHPVSGLYDYPYRLDRHGH